eukprot:1154778-Pelagomonas_calceolata.AAC.4
MQYPGNECRMCGIKMFVTLKGGMGNVKSHLAALSDDRGSSHERPSNVRLLMQDRVELLEATGIVKDLLMQDSRAEPCGPACH